MKKLLLPLILAIASAHANEEATEQLFAAVEHGSIADAQAALKAGADINAISALHSPLSNAIMFSKTELAQFLLKQGADYTNNTDYLSFNMPFLVATLREDSTILILMLEGSKPIPKNTLDSALKEAMVYHIMNTHQGLYINSDLWLEKKVVLLLKHSASPFTYFEEGASGFEGSAYDLTIKYGFPNLTKLFEQ